jgi:DNA-binding response OmpR family regulator
MKQRILVVDDEPAIVSMLLALLTEKGGYDATGAATAAEMFQQFDEGTFDLVLLDVVLGDANGLDLVPLIKSAHPHLPVAILSALGFDEDFVRDSKRSGADGFFKKTLPADHLLAEVNRLLSPRSDPAMPPS